VHDGYAYLEHMFETQGYSLETYWPGRQWMGIRQPSADCLVFDERSSLLIDERGSLFHWATFDSRHLGKAGAHLAALRDVDAKMLSGEAAYRLNVPTNVPARDFWSATAYGKKTKAFIPNDTGRVGLTSYDKPAMKVIDDGSVGLYFAESAPPGLDSNWIPTAGQRPFLLFRFYGPQDEYFDGCFTTPDHEVIE
jgi:hypothetical protein